MWCNLNGNALICWGEGVGAKNMERECARSHQLSTILVNKFVWNLFAQWIDLAGISICGCCIRWVCRCNRSVVCWCLFLRYFSAARRFSICNLSAFNNLWNVCFPSRAMLFRLLRSAWWWGGCGCSICVHWCEFFGFAHLNACTLKQTRFAVKIQPAIFSSRYSSAVYTNELFHRGHRINHSTDWVIRCMSSVTI